MLVLAPALGAWLTPFFDWFYNTFKIDPSVLPASLFANDMGGMTLANSICKNESIGAFNAYVVSSMLGCVVSFIVSLVVIRSLMEYVRKHNFSAFGVYRIVLGAMVLLYFAVKSVVGVG